MKMATFVCLRFYVVPVDYQLFKQNIPDKDKINLFKQFFLVNKNYELGKDVIYAMRITHNDGNLYFGKLSKKGSVEKRDITPIDVEDSVVDDWPYVNFVFDVSGSVQLMIVEKNNDIYQDVSALKFKLSKMAKKVMAYSGFSVNFEPIVEKLAFWRIVGEAEGVYSLRFKLESPNMLGATVRARGFLKLVQKRFNNNKLETRFVNSDGKLEIPRNRVEPFVEYADQGGGSWSLLVGRDGKKKAYTSSQNVVTAQERLDKSNPVPVLKKVVDYFKTLL
ncbi:hypothetical protein [Solidesulfovibrio sp.]